MNLNSSPESRGIWAWQLLQLIMGISLLIYLIIFLKSGFYEESTRQAIRLSARISVVLFCIAFGASAFHQRVKNSFSWWVFMNRKFFGISFAFNHLLHLFFLFILQKEFHPVFDLAAKFSLFGGGMAYVFIILMLLTSFSFFEKMISRKNWKRLHTVGGYWIWTVFMSSYSKRVWNEEWGYLPILILLIIVLLMRLYKYRTLNTE